MIPNTEKSQKLYERARKVLVEGVNSPSRGGEFYKPGPIFIDHGKGSKVYDADQNEYVDLMLGFSALVLGHAHPEIIAALERAGNKGTHYAAAALCKFRHGSNDGSDPARTGLHRQKEIHKVRRAISRMV